ncbi:hypothetical protein FOCC_FOCC014226 [Frankliniella occidentalis]|nr:hypothetical protein FOCC_FOCC014226 [Frankliniella occidentalis]
MMFSRVASPKPYSESGRPPEAYLNVYSDQGWECDTNPVLEKVAAASSDTNVPYVPGGSTPSLDNAAQNCRMLELGFVPYQLTHTKLPMKNETVWILGGSDCQVHVLQEDTSQNCYVEAQAKDTLPEFAEKLPSPPLWTNITYTSKEIRMSASGCECGYLRVTQCTFDGTLSKITASWELQLQGPISCVRFFSLPTEMHWQATENNIDHQQLNLLVACAIQPSQVFMNINKQGLSCGMELPTSASGDAVLCGMTADLDLDGSVEVLLGTYGRQLLVYKWDSNSWELRATRTLPHPVHSLHYLDVTGDGVRELLILTPKGLHVFQHHLEHVEDRVESLVKMILNIPTEENNSEEEK